MERIRNQPENDLGFLVQRYEELRAEVISPNRTIVVPEGLALFLRWGMSAWMLAWARCTLPNPIIMPKLLEKANENHLFSRGLSTEVVTVLVNMALINQKEART